MYEDAENVYHSKGMVEKKVFIVDMRETIVRGTWKNPDQGEKQ